VNRRAGRQNKESRCEKGFWEKGENRKLAHEEEKGKRGNEECEVKVGGAGSKRGEEGGQQGVVVAQME
jgi:hypothetical protein